MKIKVSHLIQEVLMNSKMTILQRTKLIAQVKIVEAKNTTFRVPCAHQSTKSEMQIMCNNKKETLSEIRTYAISTLKSSNLQNVSH